MQYWRSYWETCSTGGHSEEHPVLDSTGGHSEEHAVLEVIYAVGKHAVLEVLVRNMQYWRS